VALGWQCVCAVDAAPSVAYRPRDGTGPPPFVEQELRRFLGCGGLAHGFARVRCDGCGFERFVPFSCKGRGFCPSCGGRRMAERAAHVTDRVLPAVPLRQWVLTVPHRLRYLMAWDHRLCRAVLGVYVRVLLGWYRRQAERRGILASTCTPTCASAHSTPAPTGVEPRARVATSEKRPLCYLHPGDT
jgi:hypothetical protein